jgi:type II secretory pathway pseudopilin PulG
MDLLRALLPILIGLAIAATLATLLAGLFGMMRGQAGDARRANILMRARVAAQAVALALIALYFLIGRGS